jgi:hypothetical protein
MTAWQKFLKDAIPSQKDRRELQILCGRLLFTQNPQGQRSSKTKRGSRV